MQITLPRRSLKSLFNLFEYSSKYRDDEMFGDPMEARSHVGSIPDAMLGCISAVSEVDEAEALPCVMPISPRRRDLPPVAPRGVCANNEMISRRDLVLERWLEEVLSLVCH